MGCASSKHLKNQARTDGWVPPPQFTITPKCKTPKSECSVEYYHHHHYVALTSSSYGYLKVDSPNSAENTRKQRKPCSVVLSLNNMYDKLMSLDMAEPSSSTTSMLGVLKKPSAVENHNASSSHASSTIADSINAVALELPPETIDVQDMMHGLEESTARGPQPAKSPIGARSMHPKGTLTGHHHRKFDVNTMTLLTLEKLDAAWQQGPAKTSVPSTDCLACEEDGYANENATLGGSEIGIHDNRHHGGQVPSESALLPRGPLMSNSTYNTIDNSHSQVSYSTTMEKSIAFAKSTSTVPKGAPPHRHPPPAMKYSPDVHGNVKLNLNKDHKNKYFKVSPLSIPTRSLSRRAFAANKSHPESPLFDPDLVASYEKALQTLSEEDWNAYYVNAATRLRASPAFKEASPNLSRKAPLDRKLYNPFECFEERCPPGGEKAVVLYTTTLRGIRKTFEDCNHVREILQSFGLSIDERDVSMHLEFLNELRQLMGRVMSVPRLFIQGRYIGGEEEVSKLHEGGELAELVEGMPKERNGGGCDGCGGVRFVPCLECSGSCKLLDEGNNKVVRCPDCNENGLIQCPICT